VGTDRNSRAAAAETGAGPSVRAARVCHRGLRVVMWRLLGDRCRQNACACIIARKSPADAFAGTSSFAMLVFGRLSYD
jgi:hypothetical protein